MTKNDAMQLGRLVIIGGGGHAKVALDTALAMDVFEDIVLLDDDPACQSVLGYPVVGPVADAELYQNEDSRFFVAIGNNNTRQRILGQLQESNCPLATLIHPKSIVSPYALVASGVLIMPGAVINADARIGQGTIVNTAATIDHDCLIGEVCHLAPGTNLAGGVCLGDGVLLGIGSQVIPYKHIGTHSVIGAGATVCSDIPDNVMAVGSPARIIRSLVPPNKETVRC